MTVLNDRLQITRFIGARRSRVFEAWTNVEFLGKWFGPEECSDFSVKADVRVGGIYRSSMNCGGQACCHFGTYREIVPNEKLVFTHCWEQDDSIETVVTVELADKDDGTQITLTQTGFASSESTQSHSEGWSSALNALAKIVATA